MDLLIKAKRPKEALECGELGIKHHPANKKIILMMGQAHIESGKQDRALECFHSIYEDMKEDS